MQIRLICERHRRRCLYTASRAFTADSNATLRGCLEETAFSALTIILPKKHQSDKGRFVGGASTASPTTPIRKVRSVCAREWRSEHLLQPTDDRGNRLRLGQRPYVNNVESHVILLKNAQYPSRYTLQSPRHYRQRRHNNEQRHSSAEGTLERELRREHIIMPDTLPELTITAEPDERWHEDLPRYHVPNRTYLESIHHTTSLNRTPIGSRLPSRAPTPAPDTISRISIA